MLVVWGGGIITPLLNCRLKECGASNSKETKHLNIISCTQLAMVVQCTVSDRINPWNKQGPLLSFTSNKRLYLSLYNTLYPVQGLEVNYIIWRVKMIVLCMGMYIGFTKLILGKLRIYELFVSFTLMSWNKHIGVFTFLTTFYRSQKKTSISLTLK